MTPGRLLGWVRAPFAALLDHRSLTWELTKRDVLGRYRGASFGLLWSLISPLLMLMIYTFAFGTVMGSKWPAVQQGSASFSIILCSGLIVHGFFSECLTKAPYLIVGTPNFVKRVVFPLEILPWPLLLSAGFHALANLLVFAALQWAMDGAVPATVVLFPLVLLPLFVACLALVWLLSALGVYLRDISQITPMLSLAMLFLSTAMLPASAVPESYRALFELNPLSFIMDQARAVMVWGEWPDWRGLAIYLGVSLLLCVGARGLFSRLRRGFADVL